MFAWFGSILTEHRYTLHDLRLIRYCDAVYVVLDAFVAAFQSEQVPKTRITRIFEDSDSMRPIDSEETIIPIVYVTCKLFSFYSLLSEFFEAVLRSKVPFLHDFRISIVNYLVTELVSPEMQDEGAHNEVEGAHDEVEIMEEDVEFMASLYQGESTTSSSTTSSTTSEPTPKGRKRKKFSDGMGEDTLSSRFRILDQLVEAECRM